MLRKQFPIPPTGSSTSQSSISTPQHRSWSPPPAPAQFQNDNHPPGGGENKRPTTSTSTDVNNNTDHCQYGYHRQDDKSSGGVTRLSFGSMFSQLRMLPRKCSSARSSTPGGEENPGDKNSPDSLESLPISALTNHQRDKNLHLLHSWTDSGHYSRVKAMTIASILYNQKVTEADIRAELTPKEKFAYKKFCLEIEDKLEMITSREPTKNREPFSERTLRKIWHLYALYTKTLSDEIWDEGTAKSNITSRAIAHLVKRAIAGGPADKNSSSSAAAARSSLSTPTLKPVDPLESVNPVLASSLQDPIQAFLIVYGRYVSTGKVNQVERLRKLVHFNEIAEEFFQKLVAPPENVDIDTYLLMLRQQQQCQQKWSSSSGFTGYRGRSNVSMYSSSHNSWHHRRQRSTKKGEKRGRSIKSRQGPASGSSSLPISNPSWMDEQGDNPQAKIRHHHHHHKSSDRGGGGGGSCPPPAYPYGPPVDIPPPTETDVKSLQRKIQMLDGHAMWSPLTDFQSPPTPASRVASVNFIHSDHPPIKPRLTTTSTLLAVSKSLRNRKVARRSKGQGSGDDSDKGSLPPPPPPDKKVPLKEDEKKTKRLVSPPPSKEILSRLTTQEKERPATVLGKPLDQKTRHILKGRFFPTKNYPTPPSTPKKQDSPRIKRICLAGCRYEVLGQVARSCGFEIVGENDLWSINWSDSPLAQDKIGQMRRVQDMYSVFWGLKAPLQRSNHFPGMYEICRKDRLGRNLNRLKRMFPCDYNFFPETFDLPTEQSDLITYARRRKKSNLTFIIKPESGCQGKGIFLIKNLKKLSPFAKCVCQLYIPHPFLIDGYKFDQRIYVLITCVDPLRLYIYEEGIARFATVKYEIPTEENLEVVYMHLTNYSLNKFSESYVREGEGSKRTLSSIYQWMSQNGYDVPRLIRSIDEIVTKTLLSAAPTLKHNYKTSFPKREQGCFCFELLGFDILIDRHLNPYLLEVNHSPSFNLDLPVDHQVKTALLKDMLNMVYLGDELTDKSSQPPPGGGGKKKTKLSKKKQKGNNNKKLSAAGLAAAIAAAATEEFDNFEGISEALQRQFRHEMRNRGQFRLIYSSDKPGRFQKLCKDDNYCGYMQPLTSHERQMVVFDGDADDPESWREPKTSSSVKVTKRGQKYVETRVVPEMFSSSSQHVQKFREIPVRKSKEGGQSLPEANRSRSRISNGDKASRRDKDKDRDQRHRKRRKEKSEKDMWNDDLINCNSSCLNNNNYHYYYHELENQKSSKDRHQK